MALSDGQLAALELQELMSDWSEANWCASWLTSLSEDLWDYVVGARPPLAEWGMAPGPDEAAITRMQDLAERAGAWPYWPDDDLTCGVQMLQLDKWRPTYAALRGCK